MECVLQSLTEVLKNKVNTKEKVFYFRLAVCVAFFLVGLPMCTRSGLYIQNLLDNYISGYPVLICAALESFCFGWIYGLKNIKRDLKLMLGDEPNLYWVFCFRYLTPLFTIVSLSFFFYIINTVMNKIFFIKTKAAVIISLIVNQEVKLNDYHYPKWAHNSGYILVSIILSPLFICSQFSISKFGFKNVNLRKK